MERIIETVDFGVPKPPRLIRTVAYARVSSGKDAMLHSLSAQVSAYSRMIQDHPGWLYCGVYSDEATTGTKDDRHGFQRMLADCRQGIIDQIIVKSISRFARNTVTLLETIRELQSLNVDVFFEEQGIHTLSSDGELMITILASYAQEESLSASENQKWRIRKNFQSGIPCNGTILGYRYEDGRYVVVPEEAAVIRRIYSLYLSGKGIAAIAKALNSDGIHTRLGKPWTHRSVGLLLRNYAYTGNLLLQQTFRENHLTKRKIYNTGQLPQYHVSASHEAIVSMADYETVQEEIRRRANKYTHPGTKKASYPLSGKIVCASCGKHYRRKVTASGPVWICSTYNALGKKACPAKQIPEPQLYKALSGIDLCGVERITAHKNNLLDVRYTDNSEETYLWHDHPRSDSWTPEKQEAARLKAKERYKPCQKEK